MPVIGEYTSRIGPPHPTQVVPPNTGLAAAPAQAVAGIGEALTDFGRKVLSQISDAQDSVEFSKVQMEADQIHNVLIETLQTIWDDDVREQRYETAKRDTESILGRIKRPNVRNMYQKYLNDFTPYREAAFNKIDNKMKIDKMKADTIILDEYDYERGNKENFRIRHERNRDNILETPEQTESLIKNFDITSLFYRSRLDIGSNEPLRVKAAVENLEKARPLMSGSQLDEAVKLLGLAQQMQASMSDAFGKSILRDMVEAKKKSFTALERSDLAESLRARVLDPNNGLSVAESRTFLKEIDNLEQGKFKESDPEVRARILDEIRDPRSKITPKDISALVGKGLSTDDGDRFISRLDVFKGFWFGRADRFLKDQLGWSDTYTKFAHPEGGISYYAAMNTLFTDIETLKLKDKDIYERGIEIGIPFIVSYWENVLSLEKPQIERMTKMLRGKTTPKKTGPVGPLREPEIKLEYDPLGIFK